VPPLPPLGIVPWAWAELAVFFVHHLLGVRPNKNELVIRPRLLSGLDKAKASLILRGQRIDLTVIRAEKDVVAVVNGKRVPLVNGELKLPLPAKGQIIEMKI
jgi:cellobiose phosphorylase